jgi:hypothetical protein
LEWKGNIKMDKINLLPKDVNLISSYIKSESRIAAIRELRKITGFGLKEAKEYIDYYYRDHYKFIDDHLGDYEEEKEYFGDYEEYTQTNWLLSKDRFTVLAIKEYDLEKIKRFCRLKGIELKVFMDEGSSHVPPVARMYK